MSPTTIVITVAPVANRPGYFAVDLAGVELCRCGIEPLLAAARELLQRGMAADATVAMRHAGADHDALRGPSKI